MNAREPAPGWIPVWAGPIILAGLALALLAGCPSPGEPPPEVPVGVEEGHRAPELRGTLHDGGAFLLSDNRGRRHVLVFYRGLHCGLCRVRLEQLQSNISAYDRQGARVLAVTLDPPESGRALAEEMDLGFSLLFVDSAAFEAWGVLHPDSRLPLPAAYVVGTDGVIRFRDVGRNAGDRTTDAALITLLRSLDDE